MKTTAILFPRPPFLFTNEYAPVRFASSQKYVGRSPNVWWYNNLIPEFEPDFKERHYTQVWPYTDKNWTKQGSGPVLKRWYSKEALEEALKMIPDGFETRDVPRPPQRIRAISEGIVGRWYTNYWTLHSIRYQCLLARIPWRYGDRVKMRSNFDEPYFFVDYDESKSIRDSRTKWINIHRSMVASTKKVMDVEQEERLRQHTKLQNQYWSNRKLFVSRLKSMKNTGTLSSTDSLPARGFKFSILDE